MVRLEGAVAALPEPVAFFETAYATFLRAADRAAGVEHWYDVAGYTVRLRVAGSALSPFFKSALAHQERARAKNSPHLTICLWDSASTHVDGPPCPPAQSDVALRGEVSSLSDERVLTAIQTDVHAISTYCPERKLAVYWVDNGSALPAYERAAPLKVILHWWLRERGWPMIHAGAIGTDEGGVLLVGKSGAGKSTAAMACVQSGMKYVSDDRCLVSAGANPRAYGIYTSAKLHFPQIRLFPNLWPVVDHPCETGDDKALIYVHQHAPGQVARFLPIRSMLLASVAGRPGTTISPVSRMEVLRALSTSSLIYQPGAAQAEVGVMADLVRRVPCFRINLGSDLGGIPRVIGDVITATKGERSPRCEEIGSAG